MNQRTLICILTYPTLTGSPESPLRVSWALLENQGLVAVPARTEGGE